MILTHVSLFKVCVACCGILLSHHTPRQNYKRCPKVLLETGGELGQELYLELDLPDWKLRGSATKRVQPSHSLKHIFLTKYPQKPRIVYLWSVGPQLFLHIFISSVRIVVCLSVNFERRWIHQSLKTCISENWLKRGQIFIKHANMMLDSFIVIRSIRTWKVCSTEYFWKYKNSIKTTKTQAEI